MQWTTKELTHVIDDPHDGHSLGHRRVADGRARRAAAGPRDSGRDPRRRVGRLAGDGSHQLVERRLWTARHRHPGDRTGQGLDDGEAARMGPLGRARRALRVRARLVAGAVSRAHGRAAGDADHRVSEVLVVEHRGHRHGRRDAGRHRDGGRLRDIPRHPAGQDRLAPAGARGPDARGRSGAADDRRAARRGQPDRGASTGSRAPPRPWGPRWSLLQRPAPAVLRGGGRCRGAGPWQRQLHDGGGERTALSDAADRRRHDLRRPWWPS